MTQTFTQVLDFTANKTEKEMKDDPFLNFAEPSDKTIQNILNFSRNLEVKQSKLLKTVELLKS